MAQAIVGPIQTAEAGTPAGRVTCTFRVWYTGSLPGGRAFDEDLVTVANLDVSKQPVQIDSDIAAAVRTRAATFGITVDTNAVILYGSSKG